jgi:hypothetical protein
METPRTARRAHGGHLQEIATAVLASASGTSRQASAQGWDDLQVCQLGRRPKLHIGARAALQRLNVLTLRSPEPPKPISWKIYKIAAKAVGLGDVEAPDEATTIEKAAAEFKAPAAKLIAIRR